MHLKVIYDKNTGSKFTDVLEINTLELPKLPKESDNSELWNWLKFLKASREEEFVMLAERSPQIEKAVGVLKELSQDEKTRLIYEAREKTRRDEQARIKGAFQQGIEKGIIKVAINLLKKNTPINEIMDITELSKGEIEKLAKEVE